MLRSIIERIPDQRVDHHLLVDEGEHIIDLVRHHWWAYWRPALLALLVPIGWYIALFGPIEWGWFFILAGLVAGGWAAYRAIWIWRDVFVITNMRVFRASGVFSISVATMPMTRILDITVEKPFWGRVVGYGHFVFESAAQSQGLRDIRVIAHPDERDLTIQRVIQRSGLRGPRTPPGQPY